MYCAANKVGILFSVCICLSGVFKSAIVRVANEIHSCMQRLIDVIAEANCWVGCEHAVTLLTVRRTDRQQLFCVFEWVSESVEGTLCVNVCECVCLNVCVCEWALLISALSPLVFVSTPCLGTKCTMRFVSSPKVSSHNQAKTTMTRKRRRDPQSWICCWYCDPLFFGPGLRLFFLSPLFLFYSILACWLSKEIALWHVQFHSSFR